MLNLIVRLLVATPALPFLLHSHRWDRVHMLIRMKRAISHEVHQRIHSSAVIVVQIQIHCPVLLLTLESMKMGRQKFDFVTT